MLSKWRLGNIAYTTEWIIKYLLKVMFVELI